MVGSLGVLSVFPVAANNAGRVMGETRGNMIAQSAMAQITADSRVASMPGWVWIATRAANCTGVRSWSRHSSMKIETAIYCMRRNR